VDDVVDVECQTRAERLVFVRRQKDLIERIYHSENPVDLTSEEEILADLIRHDRRECYRLRSYIRNFLAIIEFDADRKGRLITQSELDWYASTLGKAVTDGIQYFVCNGHSYPESEKRYLAATGAHIAHMLRDMLVDISEGYINLPVEQIEKNNIDIQKPDNETLRPWVKTRVQLARQLFLVGKQYLDELPVLRCRIVGYWYCARFENLLDVIEADGYLLRLEYPKPNMWLTWLKFARIALSQTGEHAIYHLRHGSGLCGWSQERVENSLE
jgi:phytoene/squalene synthetase